MTWTKLSDDFAEECWTLTDQAWRLHVEGLIWSNAKLLDCRIPKDDLRRFSRHPDVVPELLQCGWWEDDGDAFVIAHHAECQPTKAQVITRREAQRANGLKGGRPSKQQPEKPSGKPSGKPDGLTGGKASGKARGTGRDGVPSVPSIDAESSQSKVVTRADLAKIRKLTGGDDTWAQKQADFILDKAPDDVGHPLGYVLAALRDDPDAYRYRRGNPKRGEDCPDHPGEWADNCRACALDAKLGGSQ